MATTLHLNEVIVLLVLAQGMQLSQVCSACVLYQTSVRCTFR